MGRTIVVGLAVVLLGAPAAASADITATEGVPFAGVVGTFTESCPADPGGGGYLCNELRPTATIGWGDGSTSAATSVVEKPVTGVVCGGPTCRFAVSGSYTYSEASLAGTTDTGTINWTNADASTGGPATFVATVADQPISVSNATVSRSGNAATLTATLVDDNPDAQPCDYEVDINWRDEENAAGDTTSGLVDGNACVIGASDRAGGHRTIRARRAARARRFARARSDARIGVHPSVTPTSGPVSFTISGTYTYSNAQEPHNGNVTVTVIDRHGGQTPPGSPLNVPVPFPPSVTTDAAGNVSQTSATLKATVYPNNGAVLDCHFQWGTDTTYGHTIPCTGTTGPVTAALTSLTPNTTYHDRVVVTTDVGTTTGDDSNFTTLKPVAVGAPTVLSQSADGIGTAGATLHGLVTPTGPALADCHFDWGTTTAYGNSVPCSPATPSGTATVAVAATLANLQPDTTYVFRIVAGNSGIPASAGADTTFTTLPRCDVEPAFGYVDPKGCFAHIGDQYRSLSGTPVTVDGLTLTPDDAATTITVDPPNRTVSGSGNVTISAGGITLYDGRLYWTAPDPNGGLSVPIGTLTPPSSTTVGGIPLEGDLSLSFNNGSGADLTGNAALPFGSLLKGIGISGTIVLHCKPGVGLQKDQLKITKDNFTLDGVGVKNLSVSYSPSADTWEGTAEVNLPTPNKLDLSADLAFAHGSFQKFSGAADNLNFPIIDGIYVQKISVVFGVDPTTVGGGLGLSFGPTVDGKQLVRVDGGFTYQAQTSTAAGFIDVNGSLTLASFTIANAYFNYYTSGLVQFGGHLQLGLPDASAANPKDQPVYIDAGLNGAIDGSKFDVDVNATVALNFIDLTLGAEVLVSDKGLVGCAKVSAFGFTWSPGVGYTWATHSLDLMASGCSVGPWKTLNFGQASDVASAAAAGRARTVHLGTGRALLELHGSSGAPRVTLTGPGGQRVAVPVNSVKPAMRHGFMIFQDPGDRITWIAIEHGGGAWRIAPEPGSSPVTSVRAAGLLPAPQITGHVTGKGQKRTLTWSLRPIAGQRVVFWEKGKGIARVIGQTAKSHGKLRFAPVAGPAGRRTVEAQVIELGKPRTDITIARFRAQK